jgi:hypothetical protein
MMKNPLTAKLSGFPDMSADDTAALDWLCADVHSYKAKADLIRRGGLTPAIFTSIVARPERRNPPYR